MLHELGCSVTAKILGVGLIFGVPLGLSISALLTSVQSTSTKQSEQVSALCRLYYVYEAIMTGPAVISVIVETIASVFALIGCCRFTSPCSCIRISRVMVTISVLLAILLNSFGLVFYWTRFEEDKC